MSMWLKQCSENTEISMGGITCPACNAPVKRTSRYMKYVNAKRRLIEQIKLKVGESITPCIIYITERLSNLFVARHFQAFGSPTGNREDLLLLTLKVNKIKMRSFLCEAVTSLVSKLEDAIEKDRHADQMKIRQWANLSEVRISF